VASPNTVTRWAIEVSLGQEPLPPSMERQLYLVGRELISNVHRHAEASEASLSLRLDDSRVVLEVRDNGIGFDRSSIREGAIGIRSIEQRFADLGGSLLIETELGGGTRVVGELSVRDFAAP
jgi:two-component system, NarL family, sensor kinase